MMNLDNRAGLLRFRAISIATAAMLAAATLALTVIPLSHAQSQSQVVRISIQHISYLPNKVTVPTGSTVMWTNDETDGTTHSVEGGDLNSGDLTPGFNYQHTFTKAGTYVYHCKFHVYMEGTVTVVDGGSTTTSTTAPSTSTTAPSPTSTTAPSTTTTMAPPTGPGTPLGDGTYLAPYTVDNGVKVFHLDAAPIQWQVKPGEVHQGYAFNGVIPGPVIRINEGDRVRILVKDDLPEGLAVHWHGMELPNNEDGVPGITQDPIQPGQTYTYEWTAKTIGSHWYHSHMGGSQVGKGLYGPLQVVPKHGDFKVDRDYTVMIGDQNLGYVLNGKSFPATAPLQAKVGERVRIRITAAGDDVHPMHLHGQDFTEVAQDGQPLAAPPKMDTLIVGAGQTYDIIVVPVAPGKWLFHCHRFSHSESGSGMMMTGLVTILNVT